jgi:TPR repeat protein
MRRLTRSLLLATALTACASAAFAIDPPGRAIPGNYFEYKATFYLRNKQYRAALRMFEMSSYWANKVAQYNVGVMYFNGIGDIPADRVLGTAWLGIAAEQHGNLADAALQDAYAKLSPDEKLQADTLFRELDKKYGDAVTLPRAMKNFDEERRNVTGSRVGFVGNITVQNADGNYDSGHTYYKRQDKEFEEFLNTQYGRVDIGSVMPLPLPSDAKHAATAAPKPEQP